jgi:23S rRNA pseudouridine1911/1915/1917 synthase
VKKMDRAEQITCSETTNPRLDIFCFSLYPNHSRSYFKELIEDGNVTVNGKVVNKASFKLRYNDIVNINFPIPPSYDVTPTPVAFETVAITEDFLVINKPPGLSVHPAPSAPGEITLVHGLLHRFSELAGIANDERPGIVHRLDKGTSGLMLVARTATSVIALSELFKQRTLHKVYLAIVHGHPPEHGTVRLPIGRHPTQRHKMAPHGINSRDATSHYRVLRYYKDTSLIEVTIVTGRTHQIRVHCAAMGHPLLGDLTYGTASPLISRQALHAWKISFPFKGTTYNFTRPVPNDMRNTLATLLQATLPINH